MTVNRNTGLARLATVLFLAACGRESRELPSALTAVDGLSLAKEGSPANDGALIVGNLVPGAGATNNILRFNAGTGAFVDVFVRRLSGGLRGSCCMVYGPDENLYVSSGGMPLAQRGIYRFNGATGAFIDVFVPWPSGGLDFPLVPVFGPDGNLYVGDIGNQSIRRYNGATGAPHGAPSAPVGSAQFVAPGSGGLSPGGDPQLFAFGPDGHLYVASEVTHRIVRFNGTTGEYMSDFVSPGSGPTGAPLLNPSGLTFGPDGNLYVGSTSTDQILRFNGSTGAFIDVFVSAGSGGLDIPVGLVFGPDGGLYVANATGNGTGSILRYNGSTGAFRDVFVPTGAGGINGPRVILFKPKMTMCHRPGGRSEREHTISVGQLSGADHVGHGDAVGACS